MRVYASWTEKHSFIIDVDIDSLDGEGAKEAVEERLREMRSETELDEAETRDEEFMDIECEVA